MRHHFCHAGSALKDRRSIDPLAGVGGGDRAGQVAVYHRGQPVQIVVLVMVVESGTDQGQIACRGV